MPVHTVGCLSTVLPSNLEVDLVEEVLRHHGFDQVGHALPAFRAGAEPRKPWELSLARLRAALAASGHQQAIHWAFDDPAAQRRWAPFPHRVPGGAICIGSGKRRGRPRAPVAG